MASENCLPKQYLARFFKST